MDKFNLMFSAGEYDRIYVVYPQFKSALEQNLVVEQLLPLRLPLVTMKTVMLKTLL